MKAWRVLLAMKLVTEPIGSTDYKYWDAMLKDFDDEDLFRGIQGAKDFTGYFTIGEFRKMCERPVTVSYHRPYNPYQITHKKMTPEARKEAMAKLKSEFGW